MGDCLENLAIEIGGQGWGDASPLFKDKFDQ